MEALFWAGSLAVIWASGRCLVLVGIHLINNLPQAYLKTSITGSTQMAAFFIPGLQTVSQTVGASTGFSRNVFLREAIKSFEFAPLTIKNLSGEDGDHVLRANARSTKRRTCTI